MGKVFEYQQSGRKVKMFGDLKGLFLKDCICFNCQKLFSHCGIAGSIFVVSVSNDVVAPVLECSRFIDLKKAAAVTEVKPNPPRYAGINAQAAAGQTPDHVENITKEEKTTKGAGQEIPPDEKRVSAEAEGPIGDRPDPLQHGNS